MNSWLPPTKAVFQEPSFVIVGSSISRLEQDRSGQSGADLGRLVENAALMIVWRERLSMHDADRSQLAGPLGIEGVGRFLLDDRVDLFEKGEVVGVNAVE
jgi:hypothetical protein